MGGQPASGTRRRRPASPACRHRRHRVYGTGYVFGAGGNLEGTFAADPNTGNINWVEDCHGDTYASCPVGGVVYAVSHAHYCGNVGGFPQTQPRGPSSSTHSPSRRTPPARSATDPYGLRQLGRQPAPSLLNWFPDLTAGHRTPARRQAAWTVTGNGQYVVLGGEFPTVNGVAQQGLVRFAVEADRADKQGPLTGSNFKPERWSLAVRQARVAWLADQLGP